MIVTMKKVTVICLAAEKSAAVKMMQKLGTLHVTPDQQPVTADVDSARRQLEQLDRTLKILAPEKSDAKKASLSPQEALAAVTETLQKQQELQENIASLTKDIARLEPWGSFKTETLQAIRDGGLCVELYTTTPAIHDALQLPAGAVGKIIHRDKTQVCLAVVSRQPLANLPLAHASLPECTDLRLLKTKRLEAEAQLAHLDEQLRQLAGHRDDIAGLRPHFEDELNFAATRDAMSESRNLAYISGYLPERQLEALLVCARRHGWAVRHQDIAENDRQVPTLLDIPKRFAIAQSIFDFVGILPGYFETDVSVSMLLFLSLFCGMLIGDAGYGAILLLATLAGLSRCQTPASRNGLKVLLCMSACTFAFGFLSGNWFGLPPEKMPMLLGGLPWLSQDTTQDHIKLLCFFIGAAHLSVAHIWNIVRLKNAWRDVLGNAGWTLFIWANFFAASKLIAGGIPHTDALMYALYGLGAVLIIIFSINWHDLGDVIYSPFSFVNSFVDILSYIRLFAVGLSGVYIADSFNDMASAIWEANPLLIPVAIIILLLGHLLNIGMAALSILVHGVRLNTLEFSGHIGLTWSGRPYQPLKRQAEA